METHIKRKIQVIIGPRIRVAMLVQCLVILLRICTSSPGIDGMDKLIRHINNSTHKHLERLTRNPSYSLLETKKLGNVSSASKCGLFSCITKKNSIFGEEHVSLLENAEAYTGYKNGSADVWRNIANIAEGDFLLSVFLSGIHYSVSTHLSSFHRKFFGKYLSNPSLFLKGFNDSYRINFYLTYILVRKCIGDIYLEDVSGLNAELSSILELIRACNYFDWIDYKAKGLDKSIQRIEEIIKLLDRIDCEKCQLWGKIQFEGIKASLKMLRGAPTITEDERFFIINLFMRLSVSVIENIRLREYRIPCLMVIPLHWVEIGSLFASGLMVFLISRVKRRLGKEPSLKNSL